MEARHDVPRRPCAAQPQPPPASPGRCPAAGLRWRRRGWRGRNPAQQAACGRPRGPGPHVGSSPALRPDVGRLTGGSTRCGDPSCSRCRWANPRTFGTRNACSSSEPSLRVGPRAPGTDVRDGPTSTPGKLPDVVEEPFLQRRGCVLGLLLLRDRPADVGSGPDRRGSFPSGREGPVPRPLAQRPLVAQLFSMRPATGRLAPALTSWSSRRRRQRAEQRRWWRTKACLPDRGRGWQSRAVR